MGNEHTNLYAFGTRFLFSLGRRYWPCGGIIFRNRFSCLLLALEQLPFIKIMEICIRNAFFFLAFGHIGILILIVATFRFLIAK